MRWFDRPSRPAAAVQPSGNTSSRRRLFQISARLITDSTSEWNGLGYSGTNSGGNLLIVRSVFRKNRAGVVPNSGTGERLYPEHGTTVVGNTVYAGGTPLFDEKTGKSRDRLDYIRERHPEIAAACAADR